MANSWLYADEVKAGDAIAGNNRYSKSFAGTVQLAVRRPDLNSVIFALTSGRTVSLLPNQVVRIRR